MCDLFISDLHLDPSRPAVTDALFTFLQQVPQAGDRLFLLGDIFEAWVGDDHDTPLNRHVIATLRNLVDSGIEVFFQTGNRDFLIGEQFCQQSGCQQLADEHIIERDGQRLLLMHGDSLCTDDVDYQTFRQQFTNPDWRALILQQPLETRIELAAQLRGESEHAKAGKSYDIMDVNSDAVTAALERHRASALLHGHTHRPQIHQLDNDKQRYVLGEWLHWAWYARWDNGQVIRLHSFPIPDQ